MHKNPAFQAQSDAANVDSDLSGIHSVDRLKAIFRRVAPGTKPDKIVTLMSNSEHPDVLIQELLEMPAFHTREQLEKFIELLANTHDVFDRDHVQTMVEMYWRLCVDIRLDRGDYRRAWDEVKRSRKGIGEHVGETADVHALVEQVFDYMKQKGLVSEIVEEYIKAPDFVPYPGTSLHRISKIPGWKFVIDSGSSSREKGVDRIGQMILAIAAFLKEQKVSKRKK